MPGRAKKGENGEWKGEEGAIDHVLQQLTGLAFLPKAIRLACPPALLGVAL